MDLRGEKVVGDADEITLHDVAREPVPCVSLIPTPLPVLPAITLPAPAVVPPIWLPEALSI